MLKYSNNMVFFVIQGRNFEDIYSMTKARLKKSLCQEEFSYTTHSMYEDAKQNKVRKTNAMLSFKTLSPSSEPFKLASFPTSTKNNETLASEKCSTSSSSKNNESLALRENFIPCDRRNSSTKTVVENEKEISSNNLNNLLKAKRQISF